MRPEMYSFLAERQDTYWWHRARRAMSRRILRRLGIARGARCLDLGCGPGGNFALTEMLGADFAVGVDVSPLALGIARDRGERPSLVRADLSRPLPFADRQFDLVTVFNVLYHQWIVSENAVVAEVARVLKPGGIALITEPAFKTLARELDVSVMGVRRYRTADLASWCESAELQVRFTTYFTSFGFPLLLAYKFLQRILRSRGKPESPAPDMRPLNPLLNSLLSAVASAEACMIGAGLKIPFGTTALCAAIRANGGHRG